ncbi:MAG: ABC transporter permease [Defluviitaleaceae bacterium]|nr:ABC transporter permease [Defluviitaleaceae bacterium]MCL2239364.1 ABC transporter permease [Defluviitaleaceae bacterium]
MVKFVIKRVLYIILVLFLVSFFVFMLFRTMPGDPVDIFLPPEVAAGMEPHEVAIMRETIIRDMALDQPHFIQYLFWLAAMFRGEFGTSMETRLPVIDHVRSPITNTLVINIFNMVIIFAITIPVGVYCAIKRGKAFDNISLVVSMIGLSIPGFLFGLILIVFLVVIPPWDIFPMFGMASLMPPPEGTMAWYLDRLRHMALPLLAMVFMGLAGMIRFIRSAMIDALNMDCIRTARAKGLGEKTVVYVHAFRNALIPIITIMAGFFITLFSGALAIEITFQWQGMGVIMINALNLRDIAVQMTMLVFYAMIAFVVILILDIVYVLIDPRIRFD